jgi:WD40 repeat protein
MVFWPDGKTLAAASGDQTIRLWDLTDIKRPRSLSTLRGHQLEVWSLVLLPDHTTLVSGCKDGSVCVWDTKSILREHTRVTLPEPIVTWGVAPDRKSVLTVDRQGRVAQWSGLDWQERELVMDIGTNFFGAGISPNGQRLVASSDSGTVSVWDLGRKALLRQFNAHSGKVYPVGFLPGGNGLVTYDEAEFLRQWDVTTGKQTREWKVGRWPITTGLSEDARWFVMIEGYGRSTLWDLNTSHKITAKLNVNDVKGRAVFSPDGGHLAAPSEYGFATIWETATLREVALFYGYLGGVHSVAFSPDGRRLAIGGGGKETIKLWDWEAQQELLTLEGRGSLFYGPTAFSPDGNVLGSVNGNGILHLWRAPSWEEIERQEKAAPAKREP